MQVDSNKLAEIQRHDLRGVFEKGYSVDELFAAYRAVLLPAQGKKIPYERPLKRVMVKGFLELNEELIEAFLGKLGKKERTVLELMVWAGDMALDELEATLGFEVCEMQIEKQEFGPSIESLVFDEPYYFVLFVLEPENWDRTAKQQSSAALPPALRRHLRLLMPKPDGYTIEPIETVPETVKTYRCDESLVDDLRVLAEYIQQGHLQYTKAENISRKSMREAINLTHSGEFFPDEKSSAKLPFMRHELLLNMLASIPAPERDAMLESEPDPQKVLRDFLRSIFQRPDWIHEYVVTHVRPLGTRAQYDNDAMVDLRELFLELNETEWVLADNLKSYVQYRDLDLDFMKRYRMEVRIDPASSKYDYYSNIEVDPANRLELMDFPLVQGMVFQLAAMGMLEIAYTLPPRHPNWQRASEEFLTPYDGLYAVRLTPMGSYALGISDEIELTTRTRQQAELVFNDTRLTATCRNIDPVTEMTLLEFMEKVSSGCYRMTRRQMMKGCYSEADIQKRISQFIAFMPGELPQFWRDFLDGLAIGAVALQKECPYEIYKLANVPELRRLFTEDSVLREHSVKVEGYRLAIKTDDVMVVARRLKTLGYIIR